MNKLKKIGPMSFSGMDSNCLESAYIRTCVALLLAITEMLMFMETWADQFQKEENHLPVLPRRPHSNATSFALLAFTT